ncbi:MAG: GNAT family N-acetyltransferase [Saprospiraceae bacterium]|nr:GNAT family N-acetyltransferase [Saprospiraceae bacterium]
MTRFSREIDEIPIRLSGFDILFALKLSLHIQDFKSELNELAPPSILLSYDYLRTIESCPPEGLTPAYAVLFDDRHQVIGFYYFQVKYFKGQQSMRFAANPDLFCRLHSSLKSIVANLVEFNTLIGGNLLLSGPYGYCLEQSYQEKSGLIYQHIIEEMQGWLKSQGIDTSIILIKDFFEQDLPLQDSIYHPFELEPTMILELNPDWKTFEDYLADLHSKYRIRARRAIKIGAGIERKELKLEEIKFNQNQLFGLYKQTATNAEFNLIDLHPDYFVQLKNNLKDQFHLYTYCKEGRIIAFFTIIQDGDFNEAHFLGIDEDLNKHYQLYLNILFDLIRYSVGQGRNQIRFSRTALEIKSSVGAKPHALTCYIKHRKVINNTFVPYLLDFLNPSHAWVPRHPFKTEV